jgi:hypothetical protein
MNLFGGIALFFVLAVVIYFIWLWVRTTSLYDSLFDTMSLADNRTIIRQSPEVPLYKLLLNLGDRLYPKSEYKLGPKRMFGIRLFRVWVSVGVSVGLRGPFPWASVGNSVGPLLVSAGFRAWTFFWESVQKSKRACFASPQKCVASKSRLLVYIFFLFVYFSIVTTTHCLLPVCFYCLLPICACCLCLVCVAQHQLAPARFVGFRNHVDRR